MTMEFCVQAEREKWIKTLACENHTMAELNFSNGLFDNGGRRSGIERRRFQYTSHIPERRTAHERRSGFERRCETGWNGLDQENGIERRTTSPSVPVLPGK
jgi:hypothetical protein